MKANFSSPSLRPGCCRRKPLQANWRPASLSEPASRRRCAGVIARSNSSWRAAAAGAVSVCSWARRALNGTGPRITRGRAADDPAVAVRSTGLKTYPDASIICGRVELDPDDHTKTTATNPTVIVEVLSKSTEEYDRSEKLEHYKTIPSLIEVVLVDYREPCVEVWRRSNDVWSRFETRSSGRPARLRIR